MTYAMSLKQTIDRLKIKHINNCIFYRKTQRRAQEALTQNIYKSELILKEVVEI